MEVGFSDRAFRHRTVLPVDIDSALHAREMGRDGARSNCAVAAGVPAFPDLIWHAARAPDQPTSRPIHVRSTVVPQGSLRTTDNRMTTYDILRQRTMTYYYIDVRLHTQYGDQTTSKSLTLNPTAKTID